MGSNIDIMNAMLSGSIDDVEDLPDFINPVPGSYMLSIQKASFETNDKEDKAFINLVFGINSIIEQPGEQEEYPEGSLFSVRYYGEFGVKKFKKIYAQLFEALNASSGAELLDQLEGLEIAATVTNRRDKDDPDKVYAEVRTAVMS